MWHSREVPDAWGRGGVSRTCTVWLCRTWSVSATVSTAGKVRLTLRFQGDGAGVVAVCGALCV
jgi:hypothetical protein